MELLSSDFQICPNRGWSLVWGWWKYQGGLPWHLCSSQSLDIYQIPAACRARQGNFRPGREGADVYQGGRE